MLVALAEAANDDGTEAWYSVKTLAQYAAISERMTQYALRWLEEKGEIARDGRGKHGTTKYRITVGHGVQPIAGVQSTAPLETSKGATHCTPDDTEGCNPLHPETDCGVQSATPRGAMGFVSGVQPIAPDPPMIRPIDPPSISSSSRANGKRPSTWDAIEARWRDLTDDDAKPLTKAQLHAADAELLRAVERGDEAEFWASMQATAEGGKPWTWFISRVRGRLNGEIHENGHRGPASANGRPRDGPKNLAGRYSKLVQR
ncbi:MAG: hypothetical protein AB7L91_19115 [Dehalococcoidia bacterium]